MTTHQDRVIDGSGEPDLAASDIALSAGWGTGPALAIAAGSKDHRGRLSITAGTVPGANPTVTVTYKTPYAAAPFVVGARGDVVAPTTGVWVVTTRTATQVVFTFIGTPVAASVYVLDYAVRP